MVRSASTRFLLAKARASHRFQNLGDLRNKQADIAVDRNKLEVQLDYIPPIARGIAV
jgi:hypothetical protein